jgi:hypothetical protein
VALAPLDAYEEVMRFAASRGEPALCLAMHAAMPQVLRLDLLHLLRLNFVPEAIDDPAVEADVLFAPFCESLGNGYFRFDAHARRHLVKQLDPHYRAERGQRSRRVASFLLSYFDGQRRVTAGTNDVVYAAYVEVERWVALAFFDADTAARQLASALRRTTEPGSTAARFRFAGLANAVATPFAGQRSLLAYTAGVEALERGDAGAARDILEPLGDAEVVVAGVSLPSPVAVLREWAPVVTDDGQEAPEVEREPEEEVASEPVPPSASSAGAAQKGAQQGAEQETIFVSSSHRDRKWVDQLRTFLQPLVRSRSMVFWDDRQLAAGESWEEAIEDAMSRARIAVVLVSAYYLASKYAERELDALVRRARSGQLKFIWILVEPCDWHQSPLREFQAAHDVARPLSTLRAPQRNKALAETAHRIGQLLGEAAPPQPPRSKDTPRIFLCYRRGADDDGVARTVSDQLRAAFGDDYVFHDVKRIPAGVDFRAFISRAASEADVMVTIIGRDWLGSRGEDGRRRIDDEWDPVRFELAAALRSNVKVIPVLVGDAEMPREEYLPSDIRLLARRSALSLSAMHFQVDLERLIDAVTGTLPPGSRADRGKARRGRPAKPFRVFLSSTYEDLVGHRRAVIFALKEMEGVETVHTEASAASEEPSAVSELRELDSCDALVLIVGRRYGWVPPGEERSVTELEFRRAKERGIPVIAFLGGDEGGLRRMNALLKNVGETKRLVAFVELLQAELGTDTFTSPDDLAAKVVTSVARLLTTHNAQGL